MKVKELFEKDMTEDQKYCYDFLCNVFKGSWHIAGRIYSEDWEGIKYVHYSDLASWDNNLLTRFIVLAHDYSIRINIKPSSNKTMNILIHKRPKSVDWNNDGNETCPTLDDAIKIVRENLR